jgi:hypothetical protein
VVSPVRVRVSPFENRLLVDSAKVGTVTAGTPLLAAPLTGDVFLVSGGPGSPRHITAVLKAASGSGLSIS